MKKELTNKLRNAIKNKSNKYTSHIFELGDNLIAKKSRLGRTKNEYKINKFLYENEISVPEPLELIKPDNLFRRYFPGGIKNCFLIRKDISGEGLSYLNINLQPKAFEKYTQELDKSRKLGLIPVDFGGNNGIFNFQEQKVYLIDFEAWKMN